MVDDDDEEVVEVMAKALKWRACKYVKKSWPKRGKRKKKKRK